MYTYIYIYVYIHIYIYICTERTKTRNIWLSGKRKCFWSHVGRYDKYFIAKENYWLVTLWDTKICVIFFRETVKTPTDLSPRHLATDSNPGRIESVIRVRFTVISRDIKITQRRVGYDHIATKRKCNNSSMSYISKAILMNNGLVVNGTIQSSCYQKLYTYVLIWCYQTFGFRTNGV